jgi:ABC-type multidrug transport system fused ATPase/permease subunit
MIYAIFILVIVLTFLIVLNGFLRGASKGTIYVILYIFLLGSIIASFFVAGWLFGIIAIALVVISAIISRPIAARVASRIFSIHDTEGGNKYIGLPPKHLARICSELGRQVELDKPFAEMMSDSVREERLIETLLDYCENQPEIKKIMRESQVSRSDLKEMYNQLLLAGAGQWTCGHWVAGSAIAYPETLNYLLTRRGENMMETTYNLIMYFERGAPLVSQ